MSALGFKHRLDSCRMCFVTCGSSDQSLVSYLLTYRQATFAAEPFLGHLTFLFKCWFSSNPWYSVCGRGRLLESVNYYYGLDSKLFTVIRTARVNVFLLIVFYQNYVLSYGINLLLCETYLDS